MSRTRNIESLIQEIIRNRIHTVRINLGRFLVEATAVILEAAREQLFRRLLVALEETKMRDIMSLKLEIYLIINIR